MQKPEHIRNQEGTRIYYDVLSSKPLRWPVHMLSLVIVAAGTLANIASTKSVLSVQRKHSQSRGSSSLFLSTWKRR